MLVENYRNHECRDNGSKAEKSNGDTPIQSYPVGRSPVDLTASDFNGDGLIDVAVANQGSNNVSILLGKEDLTYQPAVNYGAGIRPAAVEASDFNGDGKADLVVANNGMFGDVSTGNVSILLGHGDGTFQAAVNYRAGTAPNSVAVDDFNGDGKADLAVANGDPFSTSNNVSILLGNGNGTFPAPVNYDVMNPSSILSEDFNGDGKADLAVASRLNKVAILLGTGTGTFRAAVYYDAGFYPVDLKLVPRLINMLAVFKPPADRDALVKPPAVSRYTSIQTDARSAHSRYQ